RVGGIFDGKRQRDGTENLLAVSRCISGDMGENSWLVEVARPISALSAGQDLGTRSDRLLHLGVYTVQDVFGCERSDLRCWIKRITHFQTFNALNKSGRE